MITDGIFYVVIRSYNDTNQKDVTTMGIMVTGIIVLGIMSIGLCTLRILGIGDWE